jgi:hypothetical protein
LQSAKPKTANGVAASSTAITSVVSTELREIEIFILLVAVRLNVDANIAGQGRPTIFKQPSAWSMPLLRSKNTQRWDAGCFQTSQRW